MSKAQENRGHVGQRKGAGLNDLKKKMDREYGLGKQSENQRGRDLESSSLGKEGLLAN